MFTWPKALDGPVLAVTSEVDRRELLADWITSPTNPFFAKAIVNRMWRNFMGRGLVEPVDDFRITNPPPTGLCWTRWRKISWSTNTICTT